MYLASDLGRYGPFTANLEHVGIDKIVITYPLDCEYSDGSADIFTKHGALVGRNTRTSLPYAKGSLKAENGATISFEVLNHDQRARLEFNPSRLLDPKGATLCEPDLVEPVTISVIIYLANQGLFPLWAFDRSTGEFIHDQPNLWPTDWSSSTLVTRLDAARDVLSPYPDCRVASLIGIRKKYTPNDILYRNDYGVINTIAWGSPKRLRSQIYNKQIIVDGFEENWMRFELQARTPILKKVGLRTLGDITNKKVFPWLWDRIQMSNLYQPIEISGQSGKSQVLNDIRRLAPGIKGQTLLGIALSESLGLEVDINERTLREYEAIALNAGLRLGEPLDFESKTSVSLDFAAGEVLPWDGHKALSSSGVQGHLSMSA
jgi:hypothetical protein